MVGESYGGLPGCKQCMVIPLGLGFSILPLASVDPVTLNQEFPERGFRWPTFQLLLQNSLATCQEVP